MCPHTTKYMCPYTTTGRTHKYCVPVSLKVCYYYICVINVSLCVLLLLYVSSYSYVSSYYYFVSWYYNYYMSSYSYICPHTTIMCPHTPICVRILLVWTHPPYMCQHTLCYYYLCVLMLLFCGPILPTYVCVCVCVYIYITIYMTIYILYLTIYIHIYI